MTAFLVAVASVAAAGLAGFALILIGIHREERGLAGAGTRLARWATGYHVITGPPDCEQWPGCEQQVTSAETRVS